MMYKKTCHNKPKDMKPVDVPLKSKPTSVIIERAAEEQDNAEALRNIRILLNKLSRDNFARIADTILNNFVFNKELLQGLTVRGFL